MDLQFPIRPPSRQPAFVIATIIFFAFGAGLRACCAQATSSAGSSPSANSAAASSALSSKPSASTKVIIAAAQAQVKSGKFAEAVAALTAAETPGLADGDKQALNFALADTQQAWGLDLLDKQHNAESLLHFQASIGIDKIYAVRRDQYALALRRIGAAYANMRQFEKAIEYTKKSLAIFVEARDEVGEAKALLNLAIDYQQLSQYEKAIGYYEQSIAIYQGLKDFKTAAIALQSLGICYDDTGQYTKAIGRYEQALSLTRVAKDRDREGAVLVSLGIAYDNLSQYTKAIKFFQMALPVFRGLRHREYEANVLNNLGLVYNDLSQHEKALFFLKQALPIYREVNDRDGEAGAFNNIGIAYGGLGQYTTALDFHEKALSIFRESNDERGEASALRMIGFIYNVSSQYEKSITFSEQARAVCRQVQDPYGEAEALETMGAAYSSLSQYENGIAYYEKARAVYQRIKVPSGETSALIGLGNDYERLGNYSRAIGFYVQAEGIAKSILARRSEASALGSLGSAFTGLGQYEKATECYEQSLVISREIKDVYSVAATLVDLGLIYSDRTQYRRAISYYEQALPIFRQVGSRNYEANVLNNLGIASFHLNDYTGAIDFLTRALVIFREVKDKNGEAGGLGNLADAWSWPRNPNRNRNLGILFGKQAVNVLQSIRADIHGMDRQTQRGFASAKEGYYRNLADLLIAQGRLPEAQQVLGLLKEQEFFDFVRRDATEAPGLGKADLTTLEARADASIRAEGDKVTEAGTRYAALLDAQKRETDPAKKKAFDTQLDVADKARTAASTAFEHVLDSLGALFSSSNGSVAQKPLDLRDTEALTSALGTLDEQTHKRTVAVYTLVGDNTLRFLVYTGAATPVAREYPIGAEALSRKVAAFRNALQDPTLDPRPLAKQLYDILVGPVKADIAGAEAGEVMWSLDGTLRYLPIAALSPDGVHYLIEQPIGESIFTPATLNAGHLTDATQPAWSVLGLGVTGARTVDSDSFPALPGVAGEIGGIVQGGSGGSSGGTADKNGIFPGTPLLDGDFTQDALVHALRPRQFPLVHIASHFRFRPGDEGASYLLLGVGKLTLTDVKDMPADLFRGVDLLTLSACDTAVGGGGNTTSKEGDGSEVESFGVLVQKKGAEAVLATLWPVADASTPALMQQFYRLRQAHPELPKAEALRQAQVALLTGGVKPAADVTAPNRSELLTAAPPAASKDAPAFTPDPAKPWSHPYYWAPFILIGNWK